MKPKNIDEWRRLYEAQGILLDLICAEYQSWADTSDETVKFQRRILAHLDFATSFAGIGK